MATKFRDSEKNSESAINTKHVVDSNSLECDGVEDPAVSSELKPCKKKPLQVQVDIDLEKMIAKTKSEAMFELRKLTHQQHPVTEFSSKSHLEEILKKSPPQAPGASAAASVGHSARGLSNNVSEYAKKFDVISQPQASAPDPQSLMPENIRLEMRGLFERRLVNEVLDGPIQEEIDRTLREGLEHRRRRQQRARRRSRPLPQANDSHPTAPPSRDEGGQRTHSSDESEGEDDTTPGGRRNSERGLAVGRLLVDDRRGRGSRGNASSSSHNRHVRFIQQPVPNPDGRYPVPRRDQSHIVERLRNSPALNALGAEAREEVISEVSNLVQQGLVTTALSGEFRGVLELHIQSRAQQMNRGQRGGDINAGHPREESQQRNNRRQNFDPDEVSATSFSEMREGMQQMKLQLAELKQMMKVSFDLQLDIQRAIRQEVAAALTAFIPTLAGSGHGPQASAAGMGPQVQLVDHNQSGATAGLTPHSCPIPTLNAPGSVAGNIPEHRDHNFASNPLNLGESGVANVVESGQCVICSEGVIDSVVYRCGHMCVCMACGLELKAKALKCPICRAPITDVIRAYTSML